MESISLQELGPLLWSGNPDEVAKLELHDYYDVDRELFTSWCDGDSGPVEAARTAHRDNLTRRSVEGWNYRRVRVISEPLSPYQRMAVEIANPDEQLRWLPRSLVSAVPLPGNDCLIRRDLAIFILLGGEQQQAGLQLSRDPDVIAFCWEAFDRAWLLGIPNGEYRP